MKKMFYFACIAALATACTNEELVQDEVKATSKGISFEATIADGVAESRGELVKEENLYNFFWYAEQDRINVYANNVEGNAVTNWAETNVMEAPVYKATKSEAKGQFTSINDDNLISFIDDEKLVQVIATYPTTTKPFNVRVDEDGNVLDFGVVVAANAEQSVAFNEIDAPMTSLSTAKRNANYESVGEKMQLKFQRPFPALRFGSVANNDNYNSILGALKSVAVETMGAENGDYTLEATKIARNGEDAVNQDGDWASDAATFLNLQSNKAVVNITPAKEWKSNDLVFMNIMPIVRKNVEMADGSKKSFTEEYVVTYTYENVTLAKTLTSSNDWNKGHSVYKVADLDIAIDFPYIVTNEGRTLVVFSGSFSQIYNEKKNAIKWASEEDGLVDFTEITEIISEVALTDTELQELKKYTNLTKLTLKANTSIPENVFDTTLAGQITDLNMPALTTFATKNNKAFSKLINLDLSSYAFEVDGVETLFFNENVKETLVSLDIEAVTSLRPQFGYDRTIVFTDYANLKSVVLNAEGVALTTKAFAGCVALEKVTGKVDIANAPNVFDGAATGVKVPTISVVNAIIPNYAFANSKIKNVVLNASQVAPTEIGERAFYKNAAVELMDLSKASKIGYEAFAYATKFVGTDITDNNVITVVAETINSGIFYKSAIVRVQFKNASTLNENIFGNCGKLKQVKFLTKVTNIVKKNGVQVKPFANFTTNNIDLFVATTQDDVNGNVWNLVSETFKSITKENKVWGE